MSVTRKRSRHTSGGDSRSSPEVSQSDNVTTTAPPEVPGAPKKGLAPVSPPGSKAPFQKFIYAIVLGATLLLAWYTYDMASFLLQQDAAWWRLRFGIPTGVGSNIHNSGKGVRVIERETLEGRVNALADVLGVPAPDVASAVKHFIPSASLASMPHQTQGSEMSEVWRVLMESTD
ncbi:hypothetical protein PISMIDRAFT_678007 [Pisolithus microcarpus 441]|uniref:Unplaced genomic scaffold scaffold_30, whole genome shotgun sequence n=1 Tax=Pisolithus microcarpus 441 TaxID=765257 RepID=A0A0C9ZFB4_9AGAM|nr:hypothetical protein PISMIDRAFT_678007 [Pisolithus microcarpus 441]